MTNAPHTGAITGTIAVVLAAQRTGVINPLAERAGVSHKCLAPIGTGSDRRALIRHVLDTLVRVPDLAAIRISIEPDAHDALGPVIADYARYDVPISLVSSDDIIVTSVEQATTGTNGPVLITTADNVLLTQDAVRLVREAVREADAVIGVAREDRVKAAHADGQRNFYPLSDGGIANCNLYALRSRDALKAAEVFREGGQFMKNPGRMVRAFGLFNLVLLRLGWLKLDAAMDRLGRKLGLTIKAVAFEDGALAIDVDNERTYAVCEELLPTRPAKD